MPQDLLENQWIHIRPDYNKYILKCKEYQTITSSVGILPSKSLNTKKLIDLWSFEGLNIELLAWVELPSLSSKDTSPLRIFQ